MKILLAPFLMANHLGLATITPCILVPIDPTNLEIDVSVEYLDYYADNSYMRLVHRSVRPLTLVQTSKHCFGPYILSTGNYLLKALIINTVSNRYKQQEFQIVGESYRDMVNPVPYSLY